MASGAAATARSYRGKNRIQRLGKPRTVRATTNDSQFFLKRSSFGRTEVGGMTGQLSGFLRGPLRPNS
jgi:hypothetical protein